MMKTQRCSVLLLVTRVLLYFPQLAFGGFAFGLAAGKVTVFWLQNVYNDALVEITITLVATYLTYVIGEFVFGVSGVLAVVMLGIEINAQRTSISPEQEIFLQRYGMVCCKYFVLTTSMGLISNAQIGIALLSYILPSK